MDHVEDVNVEYLLDVFITIDPNSDSIWKAALILRGTSVGTKSEPSHHLQVKDRRAPR